MKKMFIPWNKINTDWNKIKYNIQKFTYFDDILSFCLV